MRIFWCECILRFRRIPKIGIQANCKRPGLLATHLLSESELREIFTLTGARLVSSRQYMSESPGFHPVGSIGLTFSRTCHCTDIKIEGSSHRAPAPPPHRACTCTLVNSNVTSPTRNPGFGALLFLHAIDSSSFSLSL
jgi:hypothetical protein